MKNTILATVIGFSLASSFAQAGEFDGMEGFEQPDRPLSIKEVKGMGVGAVLGGLLAGPAGLFAGGAGGGLLARDSIQQDENTHLRAELETTRTQLASLQASHDKLAQAYKGSLLQKASILEKRSALPAMTGLGMTVQFRHDSAALEEHFVQQLEQLARSFSGVAEVHVHLSGHADRTGAETYNNRLSRSRVESVAGVLSKAGWPAARIHMKSFGEDQPLSRTNDRQGYNFDRRVMITLSTGGEGA